MDAGKLTFVIGGAKSGKSKFAEQLYADTEQVCYVATGVMSQPDSEMQLRISRHQARRPASWQTAERYHDVAQLIVSGQQNGYLIDDLTMLVTNNFYDLVLKQTDVADLDDYLSELDLDAMNQLQSTVLAQVRDLVRAQQTAHQSMVIVSNEVGMGIVPATKQTRILRDLYGEANQIVAESADQVYLVVSGLSQQLK